MTDCDDCRPSHLVRRLDKVASSTVLLSSLPFVVTWIIVVFVAQRRIFPLLSGNTQPKLSKEALPQFNTDTFRPAKAGFKDKLGLPSAQRLASWVFSISIGLSAVLTELLLCEISNTFDPTTRALALRLTLVSLLFLNIAVTPALEIQSWCRAIFGVKSDSTSTRRKTRNRLWLFVSTAIFAAWLVVFWYIPQTSVLRKRLESTKSIDPEEYTASFIEACLERIGIIGISLMASLSGFAAVSSLWQTFGVRHAHVRSTDISRKESGLQSAEEMLSVKQSRLRALQRKMSESAASPTKPGFVGRIVGTVRGGTSEAQEVKSLEMEISGLEMMRFQLSSALSTMQTRHAEQERAHTWLGRVLNIGNTIFAVYCAYRILATSLSSLRRWWQPNHSFATSDPINNVLAVLTTHWDSNLDREAWSRQISFLLSGVMLLASFNAVLQTVRLFARFMPGLMQHAQTSLPLVISQIAGTYVISSALLLRSNLPKEVGGVISDALGAPLEGKFVEGWFESWFLSAVGLTATGILIGRKVGGGDDMDDLDDGIEMNKRS